MLSCILMTALRTWLPSQGLTLSIFIQTISCSSCLANCHMTISTQENSEFGRRETCLHSGTAKSARASEQHNLGLPAVWPASASTSQLCPGRFEARMPPCRSDTPYHTQDEKFGSRWSRSPEISWRRPDWDHTPHPLCNEMRWARHPSTPTAVSHIPASFLSRFREMQPWSGPAEYQAERPRRSSWRPGWRRSSSAHASLITHIFKFKLACKSEHGIRFANANWNWNADCHLDLNPELSLNMDMEWTWHCASFQTKWNLSLMVSFHQLNQLTSSLESRRLIGSGIASSSRIQVAISTCKIKLRLEIRMYDQSWHQMLSSCQRTADVQQRGFSMPQSEHNMCPMQLPAMLSGESVLSLRIGSLSDKQETWLVFLRRFRWSNLWRCVSMSSAQSLLCVLASGMS